MLTEHYRLQRLDTADIAAMIALEAEATPLPWSEGHYVDSLAGRDEVWGLVAEEPPAEKTLAAPRLMGFFVLSAVLDEASLLNICVASSLQGQGLGGTLLRACIQRCRERGMSRLLLEVRASNQRAIQLYIQHGFHQDGRRRQYYPAVDGREDALLFSLALMTER